MGNKESERHPGIVPQTFQQPIAGQLGRGAGIGGVCLLTPSMPPPVSPFFMSCVLHSQLFPLALLDFPLPTVDTALQELHAMHQVVRSQLKTAKVDYKRFTDQHPRDVPTLAVGDNVWFSIRYLLTSQPSKNFDHCYLGLFPVKAVINLIAF
ncbi:PEG10: Retrotransposon-derived protein PEG10 [Crotalus adamanteus]|uniref:PEG10: Retrotransposon-derived protein PEG10 n=1 Tax=Crotalus adamanteus TaxID=8729 RepID=A0AAW1BTJ0_CROAD